MNAIATTESNQVTTTGDHAMTLAAVLRHVELVEHVLHKVMKEKTHYGESFPGDTKKNLLKPGADKLCLAFRLVPSFEVDERALAGEHREYRVTCKLTTPDGRIQGEGVGTCSTMESKYRWRNGTRKCPECGKETIIKGKEEYGGGWLCFAKKGGCGFKWPAGAKVIEDQKGDKVENPDIADVYNTCLKMGKKRAYVDATITATAASDLFTQDAEDLAHSAEAAERTEAARRPQQIKEETQPASPKAEPSTDRHEKPADQATASTAAANKNPTSATTSARPDVFPKDAPKPACEAWVYSLRKVAGEKFAGEAWRNCRQFDRRFHTLREMTLACETIRSVLGADKGGELIGTIIGNIDWDESGIQTIRAELNKAANGEVAPATVGATEDEQPPF